MSLLALIPVLAALAGAFIGGLVAEVRTVLEMRRERRKALNRVLWTQLDLWYDLEQSDVGELIDEFMSGMAKRLGVTTDEFKIPAEHQDMFTAVLAQFVGEARNPDLDVNYEEAVDSLAIFDPILAFRLSGKTKFSRPREQSEAYLAKVIQHFGGGDENDLKPGVDLMRPFLRREMFDSARKVLREDIKDVAGELGRKPRKRVARLLSELSERADEKQSQSFEEYLDRAAPLLVAFVTAMQPSSDTNSDEEPLVDTSEAQ